ncbi:MAG: hypothetical protein WBB44_11170 [Candidatus Nanopelagicales bacterium]|nr:hypothetical protein [Candidatus Nanopelagicales bacterium]
MDTTAVTMTTLYAGMPLWSWIAAGFAVVVLLVLVFSVAAASRKRSRWDHAFDIRMADARWFADSLTLAVADRTKGTPELVRTWTDGVPRMSTLSQQLFELSTVAPTDKRAIQPRYVANAVDSLRQALDADVRLRTQGFAPGQDSLIAESAMVVSSRRRDLDDVLARYHG